MIKDAYNKDQSDESDFNSINSFDSDTETKKSNLKSVANNRIRISNLDSTPP